MTQKIHQLRLSSHVQPQYALQMSAAKQINVLTPCITQIIVAHQAILYLICFTLTKF